MRKANILVNGIKAGILEELENGKYKFTGCTALSCSKAIVSVHEGVVPEISAA